MRRREILALFGGAIAAPSIWPTAARAQQQSIPVIGFLHPGFPDPSAPSFDALRKGMRDAGLGADETIRIEARWARGKPETLAQMAQELVQLRVAVLVVTARPSIEAARAATNELPIVANDLESDPVASGYVESLAHPGGNITGAFLDAPSLCGKWLQQILNIVPNAKKVAVLWDATTGGYQISAIKAAAEARSIEIVVMEFRDNAGLEVGARSRPEAGAASRNPPRVAADPARRPAHRRNPRKPTHSGDITIPHLSRGRRTDVLRTGPG